MDDYFDGPEKKPEQFSEQTKVARRKTGSTTPSARSLRLWEIPLLTPGPADLPAFPAGSGDQPGDGFEFEPAPWDGYLPIPLVPEAELDEIGEDLVAAAWALVP